MGVRFRLSNRMGGHGFYHHGHEDGQNQYDWFLKNYVPPKLWPDAINTTKNNNKQPDFKPYGIMWGADIWNLYGTEGLVKRTPTVTRQQRRRARQQVDMIKSPVVVSFLNTTNVSKMKISKEWLFTKEFSAYKKIWAFTTNHGAGGKLKF